MPSPELSARPFIPDGAALQHTVMACRAVECYRLRHFVKLVRGSMASSFSDISVVIVAFRSRDTIERCLDALSQQTRAPREVLLLENGSPREDRIDPELLPDWVDFELSEDNLGFAGGNNRLARKASGEWIAFLNPDAYPHASWIEALEDAVTRYPRYRLFGSTQFAADKPGLLDGAGDVYHAAGLAYRACYLRPASLLPPEGEVFGPCAAGSMIHRPLFESLGGFDESFFCYNEDVDLAFRARLTGERAVQLRSAIIDHSGYGSSGRRSEFATYYGVRNRIWAFAKNMPGYLFWLLLPFHILANILLWAAAFKNRQGGTYGRAVRDALRGWPAIMRARGEVQHARQASIRDIGRAMCWDSRSLLSRAPDIRPIQDDD